MSAYRCAYCEEIKDADIHGYYECPQDECEGICEACCQDFDVDYELEE